MYSQYIDLFHWMYGHYIDHNETPDAHPPVITTYPTLLLFELHYNLILLTRSPPINDNL